MSDLDDVHNTASAIPIVHSTPKHTEQRLSASQTMQQSTTGVRDAGSKHSDAHRPPSSRGSSRSSFSLLMRKQAKADAARARVHFAEMEIKIKKLQAVLESEIQQRKAELEAELDLLKVKTEVATAEAELAALSPTYGNTKHYIQRPELQLPEESSAERTSKFVKDYATIDVTGFESVEHTQRKDVTEFSSISQNFVKEAADCKEKLLHSGSEVNCRTKLYNYNPNAEVFTPRLNTDQRTKAPEQQEKELCTYMTSEFNNFLLRKELLFTRLTNFSDRPELYASWKTSFKNIMSELNVTQTEELDLLVKWLGPESSKHAQSLRASNVRDPGKGLTRIWDRLDERYGSAEVVEDALKSKLDRFPRLTNKDSRKLYELSDILSEIESVKEDPKYTQILSYFDASSGVRPIVEKLPYGIQERWISCAVEYKKRHEVPYPPFTEFAEFIRETSKIRNDPSFARDSNSFPPPTLQLNKKMTVTSKKTDLTESSNRVINKCPLHKTGHTLNQCKAFRNKTMKERKDLIKKFGLCYRCCASYNHMAKACTDLIKCDVCTSERHPTALHIEVTDGNSHSATAMPQVHGGEKSRQEPTLATKCTEICGNGFFGKSCAKIILVDIYAPGCSDQSIRAYAVLDDQSNATLAKPELFQLLNPKCEEITYTLSSCGGTVRKNGRKCSGIIVQSLDGKTQITVPNLIECESIPNTRDEIPSPNVVAHFPHLQDLYQLIAPLDDNAEILLLIGRDLLEAHHVLDQRTGPKHTPFAQRLSLGWVVIGQSCLEGLHHPHQVSVSKTYVLNNGRPSTFEPCLNKLCVKENSNPLPCLSFPRHNIELGAQVFERTAADEELGMSVEDQSFISAMEEMHRNHKGNWVAPLPFRQNRKRLPNNRNQALIRANTLRKSLLRNENKRKHFIAFMQRMLDNGHAEIAPPMKSDEECWYLPIFGVYHPRKKDEIRIVFDSSAQFEGLSLNSVLLTGPDLTNSLLGILLRFRKEQVAVTADIEQMFYCFFVKEDHRNFLRFLWHERNHPENPIIEYRMCVHAFGNSPSPAIAAYGLRKTAELGEPEFGGDTRDFVNKDFYVDDGVTSLSTVEQAVDLLNRTRQSLLTYGNLRLHKLASNKAEVMGSFPALDLAKDLRNLDLSTDSLPTQRSLGLLWDLNSDMLTFKVCPEDKPFTRRGILSTVNSIYDPLGFAAPITIQGKLLLRELSANTNEWDEPLCAERESDWNQWKSKVKSLENLKVPRTYTTESPFDLPVKEVHVFCDASEKAIASSAYLRTVDDQQNEHWSFILGKAKVAPLRALRIPRLELCSAVLSVDIYDVIDKHLHVKPDKVKFYTDSKIVLGYLHNETRRFSVYIANRVSRIRRSSIPTQWSYISTEQNPADQGTRPVKALYSENSPWLKGPSHLETSVEDMVTSFQVVDPEGEEIIELVTSLATTVSRTSLLGSSRFERFSSWKRLVRAIKILKHISRNFQRNRWRLCNNYRTVDIKSEAEQHIIKTVQREHYLAEIEALLEGKLIPKESQLLTLNPFLDEFGLLRVGGRLQSSTLSDLEKHPVIVPGRHHIAKLLVRHYHEQVQHQGRHFTEGAVRAAGFWITSGKRVISSVIHKCVPCRKMRGKQSSQIMASLPKDRLQPAPPFSYVGVDAFGPWNVVTRKTRGGSANAKRWALLFTCLVTRAVHLEVIEEMSSSSFINALRRFISIRGNVVQFRSDRGTNFVGATDNLKIDAINVESKETKDFMYNKGITWVFNPPHSSHMGGVWERLIGVTRRILDSMLSHSSGKILTQEVLSTFLAEASAIINARPIVPVSTDAENPQILSPSMLLTHKSSQVTEPLGEWDTKDLYRIQWKRVQSLADTFWKRWRAEYLSTLQRRHKWTVSLPNIVKGDIVLLKQKYVKRNEWPLGIVVRPLPSSDGHVRKAEVRISKEGKPCVYIRPITELILLISRGTE